MPLLRQILRVRPTSIQNQPRAYFGETTITKTKPKKEQIVEDIDKAIYEVPEPPKIERGHPFLNFLSTDAEGILAGDYVNSEELHDTTMEQIKEEHKTDEIKDGFDNGKIPSQLDFFLVPTMIIFY